MPTAALTRRSALRGGAIVVAAGVAGYAAARRTAAATGAPGVANAYGVPAPEPARPLAQLDQLPPGGGLVLTDRRVVLTRDAAGTVRAFSATCTHQGCTVSDVRGGRIDCPCHGSRFDAATGAVVQGPATRALRPVPVVVRDAQVYAG